MRAKLDRFDIDYALCMYCGICVEVCPFDALFWSPEYEYSEAHMGDMLHDMDRLQDWLKTVPEQPALEKVSLSETTLRSAEPVNWVFLRHRGPRSSSPASGW